MLIDGNGNMVSAQRLHQNVTLHMTRVCVLNPCVGSVFATQFTLGGELTSTRFFQSTDSGELSAFKDNLKTAAGLSISSPVVSGGGSFASSEGKEGSKGERSANQSARLAWQARGGDTLLCSKYVSSRPSTYPFRAQENICNTNSMISPPMWASTVKNYMLWRIMDVSIITDKHNASLSVFHSP